VWGASVVLVNTYDLGAIHPLQALVLVRLPGNDPARFERFLRAEAAITAAWHVVGDIDLVVHIACPDLTDLDRLVTAMRVVGGAIGSITHLVVNEVNLSEMAGGPRPASRPRVNDLVTAGRRGE
jgi:DNA-binding Lrp family transcriptional regulator